MKRILFATLFAAGTLCGQALPPGVSFVNEGTVNAPVGEVWKIWTTGEGYKALGAAKADVDLRIGGLIRSRYAPTGTFDDDDTIVNRILAFEPLRMMAIRIDKPPKGFPFKDAWKKTWTVVTLEEAAGGKTHVRVASMGFGDDEESKSMRQFFEAGNALTMESLQKHFAKKN